MRAFSRAMFRSVFGVMAPSGAAAQGEAKSLKARCHLMKMRRNWKA
jgi:hypothetical protein